VLALILKLTLAPALVLAATRVARRLGHRAGGLVGGLPVVAAPVLLIFAVEHGQAFAASAARGAVLGTLSLTMFCVAFVAASRRSLALALALGWLAFGVLTATMSSFEPPLAVSAALTLAVIGAASAGIARIPRSHAGGDERGELLAWRLLVTALLVLVLTAAAGSLSPHLAGLLAPFPIITAVLAGFTQAHSGSDAAIELLGGLVPALVCFTSFFVILAACIDPVGVAPAFALATAGALGIWGLLVLLIGRDRRGRAAEVPLGAQGREPRAEPVRRAPLS
jgi:hypothetical protein